MRICRLPSIAVLRSSIARVVSGQGSCRRKPLSFQVLHPAKLALGDSASAGPPMLQAAKCSGSLTGNEKNSVLRVQSLNVSAVLQSFPSHVEFEV